MDLARVVTRFGGVARRHQLRAVGCDDRALLAAVRAGILVRPHRGCYALPETPWAAVQARVLSGQLTCVSGARHLGLPVIGPPAGLHIVIPHDRGIVVGDRRLRDGLVLHRAARPRDPDGLCAPPRTLVDHLGRCLGAREQLVVVDAALNRGLLRWRDLDRLTATSRPRLAWLRRRADGRAQSAGETAARLELAEAGLEVEPQAFIAGVGRVDLLVEGAIVVEVDGFAYHSSRAAITEDARRGRVLALQGYEQLRYPHVEVLASRGRIAAEVQTLLARRR